MVAHALRLTAVAIAIAGIVDPAITRAVAVRPTVTVAVAGTPPAAAVDRVRRLFSRDFDVVVREQNSPHAAFCPERGGCVVVSDGRVPGRLTTGSAVLGGVFASDAQQPDVAITRVDGSRLVHLNAASPLRVHVRGRRPGKRSRVIVVDEGIRRGAVAYNETVDGAMPDDSIVVGEATYEWPAAAARDGDAAIDVVWSPFAAGARRLAVYIEDADERYASTAALADIGAQVRAAPWPVLIYEPEATWLGTFVRRALDDDPRFDVAGQTRLAPSIAVARGEAPRLTRETLSQVGVVVIASPEALMPAEVDLLDGFIRERGGSVILLPDRRLSGSVLRLVPAIVAERQHREPVAIGPLRATELLLFNGETPGLMTLERAQDQPAIVARAMGRGRVIVSGALDAWRFRGSDQFNNFWTQLVEDAAAAAGEPLQVTLDDMAVAVGEPIRIGVEARALSREMSALVARATLHCGDRDRFIRLWPEARAGSFQGEIVAEEPGTCRIAVTVGDMSTEAEVMVTTDITRPEASRNDLAGAVAAHGGLVVTTGDEAPLLERVRQQLRGERQPQETRPMRSPWWIVPFAGCLGVEWFLRRRRGLR